MPHFVLDDNFCTGRRILVFEEKKMAYARVRWMGYPTRVIPKTKALELAMSNHPVRKQQTEVMVQPKSGKAISVSAVEMEY